MCKAATCASDIKFDPFGDRQARNVRNALAAALAQSLLQCSPHHYERVVEHWLRQPLSRGHRRYIHKRLPRYAAVYRHICQEHLKDPLIQAAIIWNAQLYFEVHEVLESNWLQAQGRRRQALQGLIKAAGAFIHWDQGNMPTARRLGIKAAALLRQHPQELAAIINVKDLANLLQTGKFNTIRLDFQQ